MSYSQAEKLQILMMCDIYEKLGIENSYNPEIIRTAIDTGNYWAIEGEIWLLLSRKGME